MVKETKRRMTAQYLANLCRSVSRRMGAALYEWMSIMRARTCERLSGRLNILALCTEDPNEIRLMHEKIRFFVPCDPRIRITVTSRPGLVPIAASVILDFRIRRSKLSRLVGAIPGVYDLDRLYNPSEGLRLCDVHRDLSRTLTGRVPRVDQIGNALGSLMDQKLPRAYVFGTGPSLAKAMNFEWSDGYRIVCNTIVKDPVMWNVLKPHAIVAADPIYHFGFCLYAEKFRSDLRARLREKPCWFMYPVRFDSLVRTHFADFHQWLAPVVPGHHTVLHKPLQHGCGLPLNAFNILTGMQLPLACSLSKEVRLFGYDGRAPNDALFWSNSAQHSYESDIAAMRSIHPAFFNSTVPREDPSRYVRENLGEGLESLLQLAESCGFRFYCLHPSFTAPLSRRLDLNWLKSRALIGPV